MRRISEIALAVLLCGFLHAEVSSAAAADNESMFRDGVNWASHNGSSGEGSYSPLHQITTNTVQRLGLAWSLDLPGERALEATPLAIDGRLYFTGTFSTVYAVDAATGRLLWKYDPEVYKHRPKLLKLIFAVNRGLAYSRGKVYVGTFDGRLIALNASTGHVSWTADTVAVTTLNTISGAPRICNGKVVIGNGGADWSARGYVTAYDVESGRRIWRFYTVPDNPANERDDPAMKLAARTWGGEWWKVGGGGGTVWDGITCDAELHQLYIGVGNSGPYDPRVRSPGGGDNLFLASIVALNPDTGKYIWHYQVNPREAWDYKATANMIATTLRIGGHLQKVLMQSPTNGFFYVINRLTGKLLSAEKTGKVTWAERIDLATGRPVEAPNIRYENGPVVMWPSPYGTHNWQTMAFSPKAGLVYIPHMELGARFARTESVPGSTQEPAELPGGVNITPVLSGAEDGTGSVLAWDPVAQRERWKIPLPAFWNGGILATAGGLVFQGNGDGQFAAYDATTGAELWKFNSKLGIVAAPISYEVDGRQYISILVGYGGSTGLWTSITNRGWKYGRQPRRLLTFRIGGTAALPPTSPADFTILPVDVPGLTIDGQQALEGGGLYAASCATCHGSSMISAGAPAPDLRESTAALDFSSLQAIVQGGALLVGGMPRFEATSDEDLYKIYLYIRARAREALGPQPPSDATNATHF